MSEVVEFGKPQKTLAWNLCLVIIIEPKTYSDTAIIDAYRDSTDT